MIAESKTIWWHLTRGLQPSILDEQVLPQVNEILGCMPTLEEETDKGRIRSLVPSVLKHYIDILMSLGNKYVMSDHT